jgi:hypothetical protein
MLPQLNIEEFKLIIMESVQKALKDVLEIELMKFRAEMLSYVSDVEQKEIEQEFGKPLLDADDSESIEIDLP